MKSRLIFMYNPLNITIMLYFGLLPIAFDANGDFKTHCLSKFWLTKLEHTIKNERYVLFGQTPQGDSFEAFFNQAGKFLFVRIDSWSRPVSNQDPWFEVYLSRVTRTITAGGEELKEERNYQVNERTTKVPAWPEDFDWSQISSCPEKDVSEALKKQGFFYEPNEIVVQVLKETRSSQLGPKNLFREIRVQDKEPELFSKHEDTEEDPEKDIYSIQQEHKEFWKKLQC